MALYIQKNPNPQTLLARVYAASCPDGYEPSTEQDAAAWEAAQIAAGWTPAPLPAKPAQPEPRRQATDIILDRLTDAEVVALTSSAHPAARRAWLAATSTGTVSETDPRFPALVSALDQLGIIAAARWDALLAP